VLRMSGIGEINRVAFALVRLNTLIFFQKGLLLDRVLFAGNMRRLLVGKSKPVQQISNTAERIAYFILFIDMDYDRFGICEKVFSKITIKLAHLMLIKLWLCSRIAVIHQRLETALLITLEIVSGSLFVKEKNLRDLSRRPSLR